ncbi:MAG: hypothetical protein NTZ50_03990 [Chloroflexi bacterium]|nr:hypothetical protein [Chloroflexota bacterium]
MKYNLETALRHAAAASLVAMLITATAAPAFAQDGPTPTPTADATAVPTPAPTSAPTPNQLPYKKQWDYEYRNAYLLTLPIGGVRDNIESGKHETAFSKWSMDAVIFPPLLANVPHKKLQKVRQTARDIFAELVALDAQWAQATIDAASAEAKITELEKRQKALLKAIERLYYEPVTKFTQLWFIDLHQFALRRYALWFDYWYQFDEMPAGFERVDD